MVRTHFRRLFEVLTRSAVAGCNELIFNPLIDWWRLGPITKQLRTFIWSGAPIHYKISMMACEYDSLCQRKYVLTQFLQTCSRIVRPKKVIF